MHAILFPAVFAVFLAVAGSQGNALKVESFSCRVTPISTSENLPSELSVRLLADRRLALVTGNWTGTPYGRVALANVKQQSADAYVLRWDIEHPGRLGSPVSATIQYRAVLNVRNRRFTLLAIEAGGNRPHQRGAGGCTAARRRAHP